MAWKIVFKYKDGSQLKVSGKSKKLTKELAEYYQKNCAKPGNDGGTVYISPYKSCAPIPLGDYISGQV